jgi:DNA-binding HxlR family transcriptional regulator
MLRSFRFAKSSLSYDLRIKKRSTHLLVTIVDEMDRHPSDENPPMDWCGKATLQANVMSELCPSRRVLELIADKWTMLILPALQEGPRRNNELLRAVGGVSQKMLTHTLRELQRNGLIERRDYREIPPRVDYRLTALGHSLARPIRVLDRWAERHFPEVEAARAAFDAAQT